MAFLKKTILAAAALSVAPVVGVAAEQLQKVEKAEKEQEVLEDQFVPGHAYIGGYGSGALPKEIAGRYLEMAGYPSGDIGMLSNAASLADYYGSSAGAYGSAGFEGGYISTGSGYYYNYGSGDGYLFYDFATYGSGHMYGSGSFATPPPGSAVDENGALVVPPSTTPPPPTNITVNGAASLSINAPDGTSCEDLSATNSAFKSAFCTSVRSSASLAASWVCVVPTVTCSTTAAPTTESTSTTAATLRRMEAMATGVDLGAKTGGLRKKTVAKGMQAAPRRLTTWMDLDVAYSVTFSDTDADAANAAADSFVSTNTGATGDLFAQSLQSTLTTNLQAINSDYAVTAVSSVSASEQALPSASAASDEKKKDSFAVGKGGLNLQVLVFTLAMFALAL